LLRLVRTQGYFFNSAVIVRVGQNHINIYGVYTVFLAGKTPNIRSPKIRCIYTALANSSYYQVQLLAFATQYVGWRFQYKWMYEDLPCLVHLAKDAQSALCPMFLSSLLFALKITQDVLFLSGKMCDTVQKADSGRQTVWLCDTTA